MNSVILTGSKAVEAIHELVPPQIGLPSSYIIAGHNINLRPRAIPSNSGLSAIDINADLQSALHDLCKIKIKLIFNND